MATNMFDSRKHLFDFFIDTDFNVEYDKQIPRLKDQFHQNQSKQQLMRSGFNFNLDDGFSQQLANQKMVSNYGQFGGKKWTRFLECLQNKGRDELFENEEPKFVISDINMKPLFGQKDKLIYAQMFGGVIYLFECQSLENEEEVSVDVSKGTYSSKKFRFSITDRNVSDFNGLEKHLRVDLIDFRDNKFIVCYAINAIDKYGAPIGIECRQMFFMEKDNDYSALNDWLECVTKNFNTIVYGNRRKTVLQDIKVMTVQQIRQKYGRDWPEISDQFSHFNDSLNYIKSLVKTESNVYEFEVKNKVIRLLKSEAVSPKFGFLPDFYTK